MDDIRFARCFIVEVSNFVQTLGASKIREGGVEGGVVEAATGLDSASGTL